jgi:hypothetical protein
LVALSQIDVKKFEVIAKYISTSFGNSQSLVDNKKGFGESIIDLGLFVKEIEEKIKLMNLEDSVTVTVEDGNIVIRGKGDAF